LRHVKIGELGKRCGSPLLYLQDWYTRPGTISASEFLIDWNIEAIFSILVAAMNAPEKFVAWLAQHEHVDRKHGYVYKYHPRSDAHSIALCTFIVEDVLDKSDILSAQAARGEVAYGINVEHTWPNGKKKTLDLAIGEPQNAELSLLGITGLMRTNSFARVFVACEAKAVMTEHKKSQPRVFDELSSSHEIVHQGTQGVIAAGITVLNIASSFASPLRQTNKDTLVVTNHRQPDVTTSMANHLRGLPIRNGIGQVGFDAYCTVVVESDNQTTAQLWTRPPAPQPGDADHYDTFVNRISRFYAERFAVIR
jgi:hypothetical protein